MYPKLLYTFQLFKSTQNYCALFRNPARISRSSLSLSFYNEHWSIHGRINENCIKECRYHVSFKLYKWELMVLWVFKTLSASRCEVVNWRCLSNPFSVSVFSVLSSVTHNQKTNMKSCRWMKRLGASLWMLQCWLVLLTHTHFYPWDYRSVCLILIL